jgi:hypothetical protein
VRDKPVIKVAQTITVPECSIRLGIIFVELRGTKILTKGDFRFYTQPEIERVNDGWLLPSVPVVPSECTSMAPSEYANIAPSTYVDCHVTKSKVQAGAVTNHVGYSWFINIYNPQTKPVDQSVSRLRDAVWGQG